MNLYTILPINPLEYKTEILKLWERNHPDLAPILPKRFTWIYENNPYRTPKTWLLRYNRTGELVGAASLIPRRMYVDGEPAKGGIAADLVLDKKHRTLGPAIMLERAVVEECEKGEVDLIYGFSPPAASAPQLKAGFRSIGKLVRMVRPLRTKPIIEKQLGKIPAAIFSPFFDVGLKIFDFFRGLTERTENLSVEFLSCFDERFDDLWGRILKRGRVIGERTASYLNWRYCESPYGPYKILAFLGKNKCLRGYLVYSEDKYTAFVRDTYLVSSFHVLPRRVIPTLKAAGISSVSLSLLRYEHDMIRDEILFFKRENDFSVLAYIPQKFLARNLKWYLFPGDKDTD